MASEIIIKDKKSNWYIYVLIVVLVLAIGFGIFYYFKERNSSKLKDQMVKEKMEKLDSLKNEYNSIQNSINVPLTDVKKLKNELDSLEKNLNQVKDEDMTLEEALEILK